MNDNSKRESSSGTINNDVEICKACVPCDFFTQHISPENMLKRKNTNYIEEDDEYYRNSPERSVLPYEVSDPSKRAHIEFIGVPVGAQIKRKQCQDESGLTEQIKRFRITNTPGELRLVLRTHVNVSRALWIYFISCICCLVHF